MNRCRNETTADRILFFFSNSFPASFSTLTKNNNTRKTEEKKAKKKEKTHDEQVEHARIDTENRTKLLS